MQLFGNRLAKDIYNTGFALGVPAHVSRHAHWALRLLVAAQSLDDVSVIGMPTLLEGTQNLLVIHLRGKWCLEFAWEEGRGAWDIKIKRR